MLHDDAVRIEGESSDGRCLLLNVHRVPRGLALPAAAALVPLPLLCSALERALRAGIRGSRSRASVYTGAAGAAYAAHHAQRALAAAARAGVAVPESLRAAASAACAEASEALMPHVQSALAARDDGAYLCGGAGVLAVAAAIAPHADAARLLSEYAGRADAALRADCDEVLYGRAGFVLGAMWLARRALAHEQRRAVDDRVLQRVCDAIWERGCAQAAELGPGHALPVLWKWPSSHPSPYLGAAHGFAGIVYTLLHCEAFRAAHELALVRVLDYLQSHECLTADGRFASKLQSAGDDAARKYLVHWCHGAAGAVFVFCAAHELLPRGDVFLQAALRAGETVWRAGVLTKGPGLCHGVSGNAYALLRLHRATGDPMWLSRAAVFARVLAMDEFVQAYDERPDHPGSLFEGRGGAICLLADLVEWHAGSGRADHGAALLRFPLFDID